MSLFKGVADMWGPPKQPRTVGGCPGRRWKAPVPGFDDGDRHALGTAVALDGAPGDCGGGGPARRRHRGTRRTRRREVLIVEALCLPRRRTAHTQWPLHPVTGALAIRVPPGVTYALRARPRRVLPSRSRNENSRRSPPTLRPGRPRILRGARSRTRTGTARRPVRFKLTVSAFHHPGGLPEPSERLTVLPRAQPEPIRARPPNSPATERSCLILLAAERASARRWQW